MGKQSRNQQASTKSVKMSPFLFFTLLIVAVYGFEVNQTAAAGYENRRPANLSEKLIPANLREKLIRDKLPKPLPSKPVLTKAGAEKEERGLCVGAPCGSCSCCIGTCIFGQCVPVCW